MIEISCGMCSHVVKSADVTEAFEQSDQHIAAKHPDVAEPMIQMTVEPPEPHLRVVPS